MKNLQKIKQKKRERRVHRTRAKIYGTKQRPRMSVFRSLKHISVQLIDDDKGRTLAAASDCDLGKKIKGSKTEVASEVGKLIAKRAQEKRIKTVIFDRRSYKYHGRIRALAEASREAGLDF